MTMRSTIPAPATFRREHTPELFLLRRAAAFQAWVRAHARAQVLLPRGPDLFAYRCLTIGELTGLNVLDTRLFRSDQPCGTG